MRSHMREAGKQTLDRRQFLRRWVRRGMLGALTAVGVTLVVRGQACSRGGVCGGCSLLARCDLPPALDYRRQSTIRLP
ncbi:MAG: hypothetical protein N3J91_03725 [Verrucomicrobiae bacterium]|nr:hypothetical protein [Verrucomicrobiae bacterium]